jgi:hypothetical protein
VESILNSIKKLLGISEDDDSFDTDVIMHINTALFRLKQLGVGPSTGFSIYNDEATWVDFLGDSTNFESVKTYVYAKVRLVFDPPTVSSVIEALNQLITELEFCLNVEAETEVN